MPMIFETFERVLDLSKAGTRIVLPVQKFTRATVQVDGTGATLSGVVNMRRGNLSGGEFRDYATPVALSATGLYPTSGAYDISAVAFVAFEVVTAQTDASLRITLHANDSPQAVVSAATDNMLISQVAAVFNGGSLVPTLGSVEVSVPFTGTITKARIIADAAGSAVVDVLKSTYSGYDTMSSIAAAAKPTLSSVIKNEDSTLTGWTTAVTAGDIIRFTLESVTTCTRVGVALEVLRT